MIHRFVRWVLSKVMAEVPEKIGVCEFDCRERECVLDKWEICPRRLKGLSHGIEKGNVSC